MTIIYLNFDLEKREIKETAERSRLLQNRRASLAVANKF